MSLDAFRNAGQVLHNKMKHWVEEKYRALGYETGVERHFGLLPGNYDGIWGEAKDWDGTGGHSYCYADVYAEKEGSSIAFECLGVCWKQNDFNEISKNFESIIRYLKWRERLYIQYVDGQSVDEVIFVVHKDVDASKLKFYGFNFIYAPYIIEEAKG